MLSYRFSIVLHDDLPPHLSLIEGLNLSSSHQSVSYRTAFFQAYAEN
jgi:hypothetical protein